MGDVQSIVSADGQPASPHGNDCTQAKELAGPDANTKLAQRDSGVGSTTGSHEFSPTDHEPTFQKTVPASRLAGAGPGPEEQQPTSPTTISPTQPVENRKNRTDSVDFTNSPPTGAGPSRQRAGPSHSSLQHDAPLQDPPRPDETHFNAIAYRRDPETVIAYLVPLPQPTVQGSKFVTEPKYFLYAPPPPHLLKPRNGASEGYVRKLNRHWQQQVRRAQRSEQTGKRVLPHKRLHGKMVRGTTRALGKLQTDDVTFLARIHPTTVSHLILIHPWALSGEQTPEEVMRTFRAQMFASKKRAKRDSILSAMFFMPALAIDTLAIFFGGVAEVDGIWMLVSVTAYRSARFITRKMGPEPKTMELEQAKLIEDAKRSGFPPTPPPETEEDNEPGAMRRSMDALRRSLGSVKYRMSASQRRSRSRKRKGGSDSPADTSRPQTTETSGTDLEGFTGGELQDHAEENEGPTSTEIPAAALPSTAHPGSELSGFLEHMDEEVEDDGQPGSSAGILAGNLEGHRTLAETKDTSNSKKGQNFQLTFYPSPAMDVLARYVQESCHMKNGQAYSSPNPVPTEEDVLAVVGWRPERRGHDTPEKQADDEEWQTRAIKNDLRQASRKAAKAWNKSCRKQAKKQRRSKKGGLAFKRPAEKVAKGKNKEIITPSDSEPLPAEKKARSAAIKARIAALRSKTQRKQQTPVAAASPAGEAEDENAPPTADQAITKKDKRGRAADVVAILGMPCFAIAQRVKNRRTTRRKPSDSPSEKGARREALKQRLTSKRAALRQRKEKKNEAADTQAPQPTEPVGVETPTDIDEAPTDTEGQITAVVRDLDDPTAVEDKAAQRSKDKSFKGKLVAIPVAIAAAIGAALKRSRDGKKNKTTAAAEPKDRKPSRFSALQERFKARRTRVSKKWSPTTKECRTSGLKEWADELKQKRQGKKAAKTKRTPKAARAAKGSKEDKPEGAKEHGAMVGLVAGCVASPVAKAKKLRDKRRKTEPTAINTEAPDVVTGTQLSPVPEELQQRGETSDSTTFAPSAAAATVVDRPTTSYQSPVVDEEYEDPPEEFPNSSQYLPGHGQSEVPVRPGQPDATLGSSDTSVEQTASVTEPQQSIETAPAGKFKSVRSGLGGFVNRKRATDEEVGDATKAEKKGEPVAGEAGRFQGSKGGLSNFKAKRRTAGNGQPNAAVENEKSKPVPDGEGAVVGGRFISLKGGLANIKAKKTGTELPPSNEKVYKEGGPGFIERLRWVWVMA